MAKKVCLFLPFYLFTFLPLSAQTFTQRIQQKDKSGGGVVTVTHSKAIDELVNAQSGTLTNTVPKKEETAPKKTETSAAKKEDAATAKRTEAKSNEQCNDTTSTDVQSIDTRRKVMVGGYKVNGYRVQAFAGGNQRKDRQRAEQVGNTIKSSYPDEPIYVHFYSPRWICRVGNYRTYEEAHEMLGIEGASIVKGKITVQYEP